VKGAMGSETLRFLPWGQFFPYLGGKTFLIKKLLSLVPPHEIYVEVFGGSAELLFRKEPSKIEVYNDIDGELVNLFEVVRNRFNEFLEKARWLLYSRELLNRLQKPAEDPVEQAVRTFYLCKTVQGKFLITLNDDPFIRETFSMFHIETCDSYFSARPVTRVMPLRREGRGRYTHVLIRNYDELDQRA